MITANIYVLISHMTTAMGKEYIRRGKNLSRERHAKGKGKHGTICLLPGQQ